MEVMFLGFQDMDFVDKKSGERVHGVKFYFCYPGEKRNYVGYEVKSYFADFVKDRVLYDIVLKCEPMTTYKLDYVQTFSGSIKINGLL